MPPGVGLMVYLSNPDYISLLWTTTTGQLTLLISGTWMILGVVVMRKMINFEV
jgi:tight adherence protein B